MRRAVGFGTLAAYVATVFLANYFIANVGEQVAPGGPHTIPVGFGLRAPSGVLWIGVAFTLRDVVQRTLGAWWAVGGIIVGAGLSYFVAPSFAVASGVAFLLSELLDFAIYTPLVKKQWAVAVAVSNLVGAYIDTFVFLWLAFGSLTFWQGQIVGKLWMTILALLVLIPFGRRLVP